MKRVFYVKTSEVTFRDIHMGLTLMTQLLYSVPRPLSSEAPQWYAVSRNIPMLLRV